MTSCELTSDLDVASLFQAEQREESTEEEGGQKKKKRPTSAKRHKRGKGTVRITASSRGTPPGVASEPNLSKALALWCLIQASNL